jgi:SSS family solute:Na+ symporter
VPVLFLGVYGHTVFPDLLGKESDQIIPLLLGKYYPLWIGAVILSAVLAAIMSTLGAQLITISTMFTKDVYVRYIDKNASQEKQVLVGRFFILVLALTTTAIALKPPAAILSIVSWAFTGYAVLTPTVLAGLYWKRSTAKGAISSIIAGESVLVLFAAGIIPMSVLQGFQVIIPVISTTVIVLVVVSLLTQQEGEEKESAERTHHYLDSVLSENETIIGTPIPALASNVSIQKSK